MKKIITDYEYKKYLKKMNKNYYRELNRDKKIKKTASRVKRI